MSIVLAVVVVAFSPPIAAGVMQPDAAHAPETRTHEGIPSFAASPSNGRMWATWYASPTGGEDSNNYLVLATSADDGKSWREVLVCDPDGEGPLRAFDPEIWVAPDGRFRWTWTERVSPLAAECTDKYVGVFADPKADRLMMAEFDAEKEPNVATLSSPGAVREIARGVMMCKPTVLKNGRPGEPGKGRSDMTAYLSVDDGKTWPYSLVLDAGRNGVSYPDGQQLDDGRIFVIYDYDRVGSRQILLATFREDDVKDGKFKTPGASSLLKVHCGKPCLAECQP